MNLFKNIVNARIEKEFLRRKSEIDKRLQAEEYRMRLAYQAKINELNELNAALQTKILEVKRTRENAETEQKRLWERLDILRDNLNSEQVWMKVWECAFSKAVDVVWGIMKDRTVRLVDLAKEEKEQEVMDRLTRTFHEELTVIRGSNGLNKPLLVIKRDELHEAFLIAERSKDQGKMTYYKAQLEIIDEIVK